MTAPAGRPLGDGDRRAAAGRGARTDRQLARPFHGALPQPLPAPVELGLRLHRPRPAALGAAAGRDRAAQPVRRAVGGRPDPAHRLQPRGRPARLLSRARLLAVGVRGRASADRHLRRSSSPPVHALAAAAVADGPARTARPSRAGRTRAWSPSTTTSAAAQRRPGRAGRGGAPLGDRDGQLPGLGHARCTRCRPTCRSSTPTPAATSSTPGPASGRPTRTTPATSGSPWRTGTPATTTTGARGSDSAWSTRRSTPCGPGRSWPWPTWRPGSGRTRPASGRGGPAHRALVDQLWSRRSVSSSPATCARASG